MIYRYIVPCNNSNSSLYYPNIVHQIGKENTPTYQVEVAIMIRHQILVTNFQGKV